MNVRLTAAIVLVFLLSVTVYVHAQVQGSRNIGTYPCNNCSLGYPRIDPHTSNELGLAIASFNRLVSIQSLWIAPGDVITMCNGTACVGYEVTVGGEGYMGVKYEAQASTTPLPSGGQGNGTGSGTGYGGGQGLGNGGGANPGGGCYGNCDQTGTVTTGPAGPPKPTRPPTNEN